MNSNYTNPSPPSFTSTCPHLAAQSYKIHRYTNATVVQAVLILKSLLVRDVFLQVMKKWNKIIYLQQRLTKKNSQHIYSLS